MAKGSPVLFSRAPLRSTAGLPGYFASLASALDDPRQAYVTLKTLRSTLPFARRHVRSVVLPEGYFYADDPVLAEWMVTWLKLEDLFDEPEIWLMRGGQTHRLERDPKKGYRFAEGPDRGREASLLLFDRIALELPALSPPLHVDLEPAARAHGFDRVKVERITAEGLTARLRYGPSGLWVPAALRVDGAEARLACEAIDEAAAAGVEAGRERNRRLERLADVLRATAQQQADENLPFDEPREEVGQQDGSLRPIWTWTYNHGGSFYSFNKISYPVFDAKGRPHPPQVCIDFVLDTFERASGTWYRGREEPRERVAGGVDFDRLAMPNRRGVESVVGFLREHAEMFEVWDLRDEERVPFREREKFFERLETNADAFRAPDVVVIHGPKGGEPHYHSFFVYRSDPVTGMPVLLAGNAGKPRVRSWQGVMQTAPLRSIKHRLRPKPEWLGAVLGGASAGPDALARSSAAPAGSAAPEAPVIAR
jgi:hypothetical protein